MLDPVEVFEHAGVTVRVHYDETPCNPRTEFDNLGTIVGWKHLRYCIGGEQLSTEYRSPAELVAQLRESGARLILPVHYSPQGGHLFSSGPGSEEESFECSDGVIYVTAEMIRKEYSLTRISRKALEKVCRVLQGEVAEYSAYLRGEVYGFIITAPDGEHLDSCWGFYQRDYCEAQAREAAERQAQRLAQEAREAHEMACRGVQTVAR